MASTDSINGVPLWAVAHLGKRVMLLASFSNWYDLMRGDSWYAGRVGRLDAVQADEAGHHATIVFEGSPYYVPVPFELLGPV